MTSTQGRQGSSTNVGSPWWEISQNFTILMSLQGVPCCDSQYKSSSVSVTSRLTLTTTGHWRCAPTCCWSEERWRKPSTASGAPSLSSPTLAFQNISKAGTSCDSLQRVNLVFTRRGYLSSDIHSSLGGVS